MGFGSYLARKGNVGGTARAVAKGWKKIKSNNPNMSPKEIAETYISIRYGATGESHLEETALKFLKKSKINPLNLVWNLLLVENADESDTVLQHSLEWRIIMREEIEKLGVNPE